MTQPSTPPPVVATTGKRIVQVGIVVRDAAKTAKRYAQIFGLGPWNFLDIAPSDLVLHDQRVGTDEEACIRVALAHLGPFQGRNVHGSQALEYFWSKVPLHILSDEAAHELP